MDWTTILTALISAISGGGVMSLFHYQSDKEKRKIENDALASDGWQELYAKAEERNERMSAKIDELYAELGRFRTENTQLSTENTALKLQKCERNGCPDRVPPRGW